MSLTITDLASATSTTSGSTLNVTGITAAVGDMLVLACAADNASGGGSSTSATITDAAGNTWTRRSVTNQNDVLSVSNDGTTLSIWTSLLTHALSSATITINFSPNTTSKAAILKKVSPGAGETVNFDSVGPGVASTPSTSQSSGNVSVTSGRTIIGFLALETNATPTGDSDTTNGSWSTQQSASANTGTAGTSQTISGQHKTVSATGNQSYDTSSTSVSNALNYIIVHPLVTVNASLAVTEAADTASFHVIGIDDVALAATEATDTAAIAASTSLGILHVADAVGSAPAPTLDITGINAAAGTVLVLLAAANNAGTAGVSSTSGTITDGSGNSWTLQAQTNRTAGTANDGTTLSVWTCRVVTPLSSATITLNFSPNTANRIGTLYRLTPRSGEKVIVAPAGPGVSGSGSSPSSGNFPVDAGVTAFAFCSLQASGFTGDGDTTNGAWSSTLLNSVGGGQALAVQYKTTTARGNQSYDPTFSGAEPFALNWLLVTSAAIEATIAVTEAADTLAAHVIPIDDVAVMAVEAPDVAAFDVGLTLHAALAATDATDTASVAAHLVLHAHEASAESPDVVHFVLTKIHPTHFAMGEAPDRAAILLIPGWLDALPLPTIAGYSLKCGTSGMRQPMDMGAARVYRRKPPLPTVDVTWQLDGWQQMLLDGFYKSRVDSGGLNFSLHLALPQGLTRVTARFKDALSMKGLPGRHWTASGTLELQSRPVMTDDDLTAAIGSSGDWPVNYLPKPLQSSWELKPQPELVRSEDMAGLPQQRLRSRNGLTQVPACAWELETDQAPLWDAFFRHRGKDGARWFTMPVYAGIGFVDSKVRFLGDVAWTPRAGGKWNVAAGIEIREREVLSDTELRTFQDEDPATLFEVIDQISGDADQFVGS